MKNELIPVTKIAIFRGGNVAGVARKKLEQETSRKVISHENNRFF